MIRYLRFLFLLALPVLFASCEKEVHINLDSSPSQVVVQGVIETDAIPYVILTSTVSFFSKVDLAEFEKSFLHGAEMTVSDGSRTIPLKEYSFDTGASSKFYVYSIDTTNLATNLMKGEVGKFYTLTIKYNGKTYTSTTKIPNPKGVDTAWFGTPTFLSSRTPDSAQQLFVNYTDPDTIGNYVRYFSRKNNGVYYPAGLFDDQVINGKTVAKISLYAGYEDSTNAKGDSLRYFYPGDTVTIKWSEIDRGVYKFWNTLQFASNSIGNPFSSPINVQSNVSGGAVGVWAGYGSILKTVVVPR